MSISESVLEYNLRNVVTKNRMKGLWRLMTGYHWHYFFAVVSLGISATAKTTTYLLIKYFVDDYLIKKDPIVSLPLIAAGFIFLAGIEGGFAFLSGKLAAQTSEGTTRRLRNYLFDQIQHLSFSYHDKVQTGELIQRCTSDVDAMRRFFADQAIGIGRVFILFFVNFGMLLTINVKLALISIIVVPFVLATSIWFFKRISKAYEAYQEQDAVVTTTLQENLSGVRVVKAFARQEYEMGKFEKQNWDKYLRGKKLNLMHSLFWPVTDIICGVQLLTGLLMGALFAINGTISVGSYLAYAGMVGWIIWPMRNLGRLIVQLSTGMVSFGRVKDIIKQHRENLDEGEFKIPTRINGEIHFENVGFKYSEGDVVLEDINFHVNPGQVIALLGSTGSGKTSLVNLLPRFYEYTSGKILIDNIELKDFPKRYLRSQIGIVEQEPFLFSRSIRENIIYGVDSEVDQKEIEAAAKAAAIHDVILNFPEGYKTLVGEKGVTLSGGQKQRVAIARTLLKNPKILILDDSTSSVDTETEAEIRTALKKLMENRTTFIIAHRIQSILNADLILVLDKGKIVQHGNHEQLMEQTGIYRDIYNIQTRIEQELEKEISHV
ncbi:MAG: ABC transporter ATP-binding protein [Chloroflexi bacterium HGW-Chloroflexi-8]|nr:MAG: ABC transporter ATP-binding protein [Chloroflexi bacterium HGW-Chloroflexi-8]